MLHWPILIGTKVVLMPKFELEPFCALVQRYKTTACMLVPPIALLLAREKVVDKYDMSSLKLIISGAAPMGPELEKELSKRLGCNVAQGMSFEGVSFSRNRTSVELMRIITPQLTALRKVRLPPIIVLLPSLNLDPSGPCFP